MQLSKHVQGGVTIIGLDGELDSGTAARTKAGLDELLPDHGSVVLDLSRASYMSSAGLRVLLLVHRRVQATGVALSLAGLTPEVREAMVATGFLDFFTVLDTVPGDEVVPR
ncbi:STAS domain-containing protein [Actinokineospora auranticolor]|uniref:Anti-sigma factor antagonist n=1 Tax=Actinokineospora auranticolor TaxID=155976 RepID=A0A2S6GJP5_9PSEU|nr:STAS domain-containing protein [Actinokineospora auranticolor]PPK65439.1 anti-sigma B factor antagonist/stage II sporulation protein AA (anti-sigma F factor antagonist) [Actinokineospora auranticolor]